MSERWNEMTFSPMRSALEQPRASIAPIELSVTAMKPIVCRLFITFASSSVLDGVLPQAGGFSFGDGPGARPQSFSSSTRFREASEVVPPWFCFVLPFPRVKILIFRVSP